MGDLDLELIGAIRDSAYRGIKALKAHPRSGATEGERQSWGMERAVAIAGLDTPVMAVRPFTPDDPPTSSVDIHWLLGLAWALAREWRVRPDDRPALDGYAAEHDSDREGAKTHLLMRSVLLVQAARQMPTTVRIGRHWITDTVGRKMKMDPIALEYTTFLRWFVGRSLRTARHLLREYKATATDPIPIPADVAETIGALDSLVALEDTDTASEIDRLRELASPRQTQILDALHAAIRDGAEPEEARQIAAAQLGMNPSTLRTQLERLRKKAM